MEYDNSYKLLFSHAAMVEDLLRGFVREAWVDELDFSTLEKVNGSYVSDDLRGRADDVVWRVRWGKEWLYVYLLLEFQSRVDPWMALRIMTYVGLLYQDLVKGGQFLVAGNRRLLPPVLPVVLYNGDACWTAATDMEKLVQQVPGGLGRYCPRLRYMLLSEREYRDEDLEPLRNLVAALFRLENSRTPQNLLDVVTRLLEWLSDPQQDSLRRAFTVWFRRVLFPTRLDDEEQPSLEELTEVKSMLAARVKEWNQQSLEKGLQKGRREGLQKGRREGAAQLLIRLLELKFGPLSDDIKHRVREAEEEQVQLWSERILSAQRLGDVFGN